MKKSAGNQRHFELTRFDAVLLGSSAAYLVKGLIPRAGLVVIWGPPKCGKSFWTFDLAMHVALGWEYRERRVHQGAVVYLALEGGHGFRARIEAFRQQHDIADAPFYLITERTDLVRDDATLIADIRNQIGTAMPVLIVIDTLNRSLAGSESKDEDMAAYIRAADAIRAAFDCAIAIVHHCGVDSSRPRGHTSLTGAADAQHSVERDAANHIVVTVEWMKDGKEGDVIVSRLDQINLGTDEDGDAITSCVVVAVEGEPILTVKKRKESQSIRTFRDAFTEAIIIAGQTVRVRGDGPAVRAAKIVDVRTQFNTRWGTGETDNKKRADRQYTAFTRALRSLNGLFTIWVQGDVEWISERDNKEKSREAAA